MRAMALALLCFALSYEAQGEGFIPGPDYPPLIDLDADKRGFEELHADNAAWAKAEPDVWIEVPAEIPTEPTPTIVRVVSSDTKAAPCPTCGRACNCKAGECGDANCPSLRGSCCTTTTTTTTTVYAVGHKHKRGFHPFRRLGRGFFRGGCCR